MNIKKIQQYIAEVNAPADLKDKYDMVFSELIALLHGGEQADMIALAFNFGFAKGYRAGREETQA